MGMKSDSATSPDCATRIAQLGLRNSQDCATPFAQLDCATLIAQLLLTACATSRIAQLGLRNSLVGLRNLASATPRIAQLRLRNFQDCATLIAQLWLRNSECATLQQHFLQTIPAPIEIENDTCRPQEQDVIKIPTSMELQTDLEPPQG